MRGAVLAAVLAGCGGAGSARPALDAAPIEDARAAAPFPVGVRDLADFLEPLRASGHLPALGAAIVEHGQVTALGVVGRRAIDQDVLARWDDRWHLGSDTKAMTAMLTARLVERGVLAWTTPLPAMLPGATVDAAYQAVTPIELLSHHAGLPSTIPPSVWDPLWLPGDVMAQRATFARQVLALAPAQPVGTYAYANAGYMVQGAALEALTATSWEQLMRAEVFGPLGMASCGFGMPATPGQLDQPWGHRDAGGGTWVPVPPGPGADNPPALGPAGTVHCSLTDWARLIAANLAGDHGDETYLHHAAWQRLHTPVGDGYALGWLVVDRSWAGGVALTHDGSNTMNYAVVWAAPATDRAYLVVTNRGDAAAETDAVVGALIGLAP